MRVTRLEEDPRGGVRVEVDGRAVGSVAAEAVLDLGLRAGAPLDEEAWPRLELELEAHAATRRALGWLSVHARARREVELRLLRAGFRGQAVELALARLERLGYLDDAAVARRLVEERGREWGTARLRQELRRRGLPPAMVEEALASAGLPGEEEVALELARRRWLRCGDLPAEVCRRRLAGFLRRRGFAWQVVEEVLARLDSDFRAPID
ncbi:MAG: regulatory protein RecX [Clostridia bacterium]|nr:regulatory protein RecX [Clostridia bacterium]MCL6520882.1 recombination regulator RecX [Bacillota bacterium]